jgi:hypothetical protein
MMSFLHNPYSVIASHKVAKQSQEPIMGLLRRDFVTPRNDGGMLMAFVVK